MTVLLYTSTKIRVLYFLERHVYIPAPAGDAVKKRHIGGQHV